VEIELGSLTFDYLQHCNSAVLSPKHLVTDSIYCEWWYRWTQTWPCDDICR